MDKQLTYEQAMEELQVILNALETGQTGIDDLSDRMKRAAELVAFCQNKLRAVEEEMASLFPKEEN